MGKEMNTKEVEMGERFWLIPNSDHSRTQKSLSKYKVLHKLLLVKDDHGTLMTNIYWEDKNVRGAFTYLHILFLLFQELNDSDSFTYLSFQSFNSPFF